MPTQSPSPQTVLVIDDDATMRDLLSIVLGMEGHTVLLADSGQDALDLLAASPPAERPTVLLTDLQMPGLSGAPLAAGLRAAAPQARLIAMSGTRPPANELQTYDAFLQKPFTADGFATAISSLSSTGSEAEESAPQAPTGLGEDASSLPVLDETVYTQLAASMPPASLKQLYAMCLDDADARIARMRLSAGAGDGTAFSREAHAIKGSCGMLGARELHDLASRMETGALLCTSLLNLFPHAAQRLRRILDART